MATGIFNSGTNVGALLTPLVVPRITLYLGLGLGVRRSPALLGFLWLGFWWIRCIARRSSIRGCRPRNSPTSRAIRPKR